MPDASACFNVIDLGFNKARTRLQYRSNTYPYESTNGL
jgi:hypothetical protein